MEKKWFVFYTKSRQEKKVNELLLKREFEPFLQMQSVMRQWSARKKEGGCAALQRLHGQL